MLTGSFQPFLSPPLHIQRSVDNIEDGRVDGDYNEDELEDGSYVKYESTTTTTTTKTTTYKVPDKGPNVKVRRSKGQTA